jgi:hypothetical protein
LSIIALASPVPQKIGVSRIQIEHFRGLRDVTDADCVVALRRTQIQGPGIAPRRAFQNMHIELKLTTEQLANIVSTSHRCHEP